MIRPVLTELALFLLPFVVFALFLWMTKGAVFDRASWPNKTLATLSIVALVLMIGSFIVLSHFSGAPPGTTYVPAHFDDKGNFVPGEFR